MKNKIKLNRKCAVCKKIIYIGDGTILNGRSLHFKCLEREIIENEREEVLKLIDNTNFHVKLLEIISEWVEYNEIGTSVDVEMRLKNQIHEELKQKLGVKE